MGETMISTSQMMVMAGEMMVSRLQFMNSRPLFKDFRASSATISISGRSQPPLTLERPLT